MVDRKMRGLVLLVALVAGAAGVVGSVALGASRSQRREPASAEDKPATGELERKVADLERQLHSVRAEVASGRVADAKAASEPPEQAPAPAASPGRNAITMQQRDQMIVDATLDKMETEMKQRPADRGWEEQSRTALTALFAKPELAGSILSELSCTQTLCKSVVSHDSPETKDRFVGEGGLSQPPFNTNYFFHYAEDTHQTVVYYARPGERLPRADYSGIPAWN